MDEDCFVRGVNGTMFQDRRTEVTDMNTSSSECSAAEELYNHSRYLVNVYHSFDALAAAALSFNASRTPKSIMTSSEPPMKLVSNNTPAKSATLTWNDQAFDAAREGLDTCSLPGLGETQATVQMSERTKKVRRSMLYPMILTHSFEMYCPMIPP